MAGQFETRIRDHLCDDLEKLEFGLTLIKKELRLDNSFGASGFVDILARDQYGHIVVIEIKRSDQAARQALHELTKYVALLKSSQGIRSENIRCMLVSTEWHELAVPFSEYLRIAEVPTIGYVIVADDSGAVIKARVFHALTLEAPLDLARSHQIHFFTTQARRDLAIPQLADLAVRSVIQDFAIFSADYQGDSVEVIFPFAAYFVFSSPANGIPDDQLQKVFEGREWDELEDSAENFLCWMENDLNFDRDDAEIGYPEKLATMANLGWRLAVVNRSGRYASNQAALPDDRLIAEAMKVEGGAAYYIFRTASPRFPPSWQAFKDGLDHVLTGCSPWQTAVRTIVNGVEAAQSKATVSVAAYNTSDIINTLSTMFDSGSQEYLPRFQLLITDGDLPVTLYVGELVWDGSQPQVKGNELIESNFDQDGFGYFVERHFNAHHEKNDQMCMQLGFHAVILRISSPGGQREKVEAFCDDSASFVSPPKSIQDFVTENKEFGRSLLNTIRKHSSGMVSRQ